MNPMITEFFLQGKDGNYNGGEDRLIISKNCYGVIDGATDVKRINWGTKEEFQSSGAVLADICKEVLESEQTFYPDEVILSINEKINRVAQKAEIDLTIPKNKPAASFAVYVPRCKAVYHVGDCQFGFVIKNNDGNKEFQTNATKKAIDDLNESLRATIAHWYKRWDMDPFKGNKDLAREFIMPLFRDQGELQNTFANDEDELWHGLVKDLIVFNVVDGDFVYLEKTDIPKGTTEVILASDGFKEIKPTLYETKYHHEELLFSDPNCIYDELKGTKRTLPGNVNYDDMAYIRIRI